MNQDKIREHTSARKPVSLVGEISPLKESPRKIVSDVIKHGVRGRVPKGELCINDSLIKQALKCDRVGFEERRIFVDSLGLDIFTISPVYPDLSKRLPKPEECRWPALEQWTTQTPLFIFAILDGGFEWGMRIFGFEKFLILPKSSPLTLGEFIQKVEALKSE